MVSCDAIRYPTTTATASATVTPTTTSTSKSTATSTATVAVTGTPTEQDDTAAAADRTLKLLNGELGKGVVFLSEAQVASLLEQLDIDAFDYYVDKLASFIIRNDAKV